VLENRRRTGFDRMLPGEGLFVWRVDTDLEQNRPDNPAMALVQARRTARPGSTWRSERG
jgi:hypothetical protein